MTITERQNPKVIALPMLLLITNHEVGEKGDDIFRYTTEKSTENTTVPIILYFSRRIPGNFLSISLLCNPDKGKNFATNNKT